MARGHPDWGNVGGGLQSIAELDTYIATYLTTGLLNESRFIASLFNPAASGRIVTVHRVLVNLAGGAAAAADNAELILHRTSTLGTGTAVTPRPMDLNSPVATPTAREDLTVAPTTSHVLARLLWRWVHNATSGIARITPLTDIFELYRHQPGAAEIPLRLRAGQGIAVEAGAGNLAFDAVVIIQLTEEAA